MEGEGLTRANSFKFYLTWLTISIGSSVYFMVDGLTELSYPRGTAFSGLKALLPTLIIFQLFRIVFIKDALFL